MEEFILLSRGDLVPPVSVDACVDTRYPRVTIDEQGAPERGSLHYDGCMRAWCYDGEEKRRFLPVDVKLDSLEGAPYWWSVRGEVRSPVASHAAFDEALRLTFRSNLCNGTYDVESPPDANVMMIYQLTFRDPPNYPGQDVHLTVSAMSGKVTLCNDPVNYLMAGAFDEVVIPVPALRPLIGAGPRWPYKLYVRCGYFEVMRP
ncbi:hypothetical protein PCA31118_04652 [Pandoraea captiosa]|uniref:Uncharacterized protein n=1 Tax=Pandoraea captiosa TaxID=2508302 RepID=A0A5E5AKJ0_9BURK|nr:hypothetical protein [Pandoraea captiosa]VVE73974.1 hypothetical protein PCA31118_04652 [Pandoraea captiosa]